MSEPNRWYKSYPDTVSHTIDPDRFDSIPDAFLSYVKEFADKTAFSNFGSEMSYVELDRKSRNFAGYLQSIGLQKGTRVAIMLPNVLQYPVAMLGILRAGMVVVNVNPLYTASELEHQLRDSGTEVIVVINNYADTLQRALEHVSLRHVIVTGIGDLLGGVKGFGVNFILRYIKKMVPKVSIPGAVPFCVALKKGGKTGFIQVPISNQDIAFLQYTGGTTGVAKGAVLTHRNMLANVTQCAEWVKGSMQRGEDLVIGALPLYHIFSLTVCCMTFMSMGSECLLVTNPRDLDLFIKILHNHAASVFVGLNTLFNALLNHPDIGKADFSRLRVTIAGGMSMQPMVAERWKEATGVTVTEGYGLTEASPVVTINRLDNTEFNGSIGLPIPSTETRICDEAGNELDAADKGELCVRGPQVMQGYWNRPEETANVLDQEGWLRTGDVARIAEDGHIYIVDRIKDMILVSGFNVYPSEVEAVISECPGVMEVAVIGVDCHQSGEKVKAFVVRKDNFLTKEGILAYCDDKLTRYKLPKFIEFVKVLPKSPVGKVLRRKLKEPA